MDSYMLDMELPGCKKEDIHLELNDGYLNVSASHNTSKDEKDDKGNVIRQERYSGTFSRSFYVGENVREEDIKASYDNGELKITFPKAQEEASGKENHHDRVITGGNSASFFDVTAILFQHLGGHGFLHGNPLFFFCHNRLLLSIRSEPKDSASQGQKQIYLRRRGRSPFPEKISKFRLRLWISILNH